MFLCNIYNLSWDSIKKILQKIYYYYYYFKVKLKVLILQVWQMYMCAFDLDIMQNFILYISLMYIYVCNVCVFYIIFCMVLNT